MTLYALRLPDGSLHFVRDSDELLEQQTIHYGTRVCTWVTEHDGTDSTVVSSPTPIHEHAEMVP